MIEKSRCNLDYVILFAMIFRLPSISRFGFRMPAQCHVYNTWGVLIVLFFFLKGDFKIWTTDSIGMQYFVFALAQLGCSGSQV